jgi:membrane-associated phospholipid phosphatase
MAEKEVDVAAFADEEDEKGGTDVTRNQEYSLPGVPPFFQVEPEASFWARCRYLTTVTRTDVRNHIGTVPRYPAVGSDEERRELEEILLFQDRAHDSAFFDREYRPRLSRFLQDKKFIERPPAGAVLNRRGPGNAAAAPIIKNGAELATLFEAETPGLWHQHVFNVLLDSPADPANPDGPLLREMLSPPRQSLIWHALYTAIDSALAAVWHYKWLATGLNRVAFRRRPREADDRPIVYDFRVEYERDGDIRRNRTLKDQPQPSPGTPRHPAYGSGHSTYSAAASYVLGCLLGPAFSEDFEKLAENIGEARIWGGVHWRSDHTFGRQIGITVGRLVITQLNRSGISPEPSMHVEPPSREELERQALAFARRCGQNENDFCASRATENNLQGQQG